MKIREVKKSSILVAVVVVVVLIFFVGLLVTMMSRGVIKNTWSVRLFKIVRVLRKTTDVLFLPYYFEKVDLPVYDLTIDKDDYDELNKNLPPPYADQTLADEYKQYVPATLNYENNDYQVKVHYRGENSSHWSAPKKSWKVKMESEELINGMSELNLILPFDRYYIVEEWNNWRAKKMGMWVPASRLVKLKVNGENMGVYWETEGWNKEMLEKDEKTGDANLYQTREGYNTQFYYDYAFYWDKYTRDAVNQVDNYAEIQKLLDVLNMDENGFLSHFPALVDMEHFYLWQIHSILVGSPHQLGDNLRLYFDNTKGKFEFVPWDVGPDSPQPSVDLCTNEFFAKFFLKPELVFERNKILWEYVKDDKNLEEDLAVYDQLWNKHKVAFYQDGKKVKSNLQAWMTIRHYRQNYIDNYRNIQQAFARGKVDYYFGAMDDNLTVLNITVDTFGAVEVTGIEPVWSDGAPGNYVVIEDSNNNGLLDQTDKVLSAQDLNLILMSDRITKGIPYPIETVTKNYKFFIKGKSKDIKDFKINAINYFTGQKIL